MNNYDLLKITVNQSFMSDMQLGIDEYKGMFMDDIAASWVDIEQVKQEFEAAQSDAELDWFAFAIETKLLNNSRHQYDESTKDDIVTLLKALMSDGLYPEKRLSESEIELLRYDTLCILRGIAQTGEGEGWMSVEEIIQRLSEKRSRWAVLEPYHFFSEILDNIGIPYYMQNVEQIKKRPLEQGKFRITPRGVNFLESTFTKWIQGMHPDAEKQP